MRCPSCGADDTRVIDSRTVEDGAAIRRRRRCEACGRRFSTVERVEQRWPMVIKKDGAREAFSVEKIERGMAIALQKRPVAAEAREAAVRHVLARIEKLDVREIPSKTIGAFVMEELKKLDPVAYVRFASVYREFKDVGEFIDAARAAQTKEER